MRVELDSYECRHGFGYTKFSSSKNGLKADTLYMVPNGENAVIQQITLTNTSSSKKSVSLVSYVEWCLYNALDDTTNFQRNFSTGEVEIEGSAIYHKTEYRERRNHFAFYSVNAKIDGFDTDRETFLGLQNNYDSPDTVMAGKSGNFVADGWSPGREPSPQRRARCRRIEDLHFRPRLYRNGRESKKWAGENGCAPASKDLLQTNPNMRVINKEKAIALQKRFETPAQVEAAFDGAQEVLGRPFFPTSPSRPATRSSTAWPYGISTSASLPITSRAPLRTSRAESAAESDSATRARTCSASCTRSRPVPASASSTSPRPSSRTARPTTSSSRSPQRGNADVGSHFNDDPLWLVLGVGGYIRETGDTDFLNIQVPFDNSPTNKASMFEHLKRSFHYTVKNIGPHGLPLIGRADWNDCLNLNCFSKDPNDSFQTSTNKDGKNAESVMIAQMFVYVAPEYAAMCRLMGKEGEAKWAEKQAAKMAEQICKTGWDGEWYIRAYDDLGGKIGSNECVDGKIFIESQGFGSMAQVGADKGYPIKALDSVKKHLDTKYGIVILDPPYKDYHIELGEVSSYPPGYKENAGIFCHNNPWVIIGEVKSGRPAQAWEYYKKIAPAYLEDISEIHRLEPYVYAQMVAGKAARRHGEAKNSWLTGTAAWNFVALSQWICGVRSEYAGLRVEPRLPEHVKNATITRMYRGSKYVITVENKNPAGKVALTVTSGSAQVDGSLVAGGVKGSTIELKAVIG